MAQEQHLKLSVTQEQLQTLLQQEQEFNGMQMQLAEQHWLLQMHWLMEYITMLLKPFLVANQQQD